MLKTILANLRHRKLRMLATSVAVLLGVMFTSGTLVLTDSLNHVFDELFSNAYSGTTAVVRSNQTIEATITGFGTGTTRGRVPSSYTAKIERLPHVAAAVPNVLSYTQIIDKHGKAVGNPNQGPPTLGGNWAADPGLNPYHMVEGRPPANAGEIAIDQQSANTTKYRIGDTVPILTPTGQFEKRLVGIAKFGDKNSAGGASAVFFTLPEAQKVLAFGAQADEILVRGEPGVTEAQLVTDISAAHLANAEVITATQAAQERKDASTQFVGFFSIFLLVFAAIALLVGAFIIANTFAILVAQRTRELALLRALGASRRQVLGSVVLEAVVVGILGSVIGLMLGFLIATGLQAALFAGSGSAPSTTLTPRTVVASFAIGVGITVLSAILPARRASKVAPIEAMRGVAVEDHGRGRVRSIIGLALLLLSVAGLVLGAVNRQPEFVGVGALFGLAGAVTFGPALAVFLGRALGSLLNATGGIASHLGRQNVLRNPKRTASTASALMIGTTLVCAISVFAASAVASINQLVDDNFSGAVVVQSTGNGIPLSLVDELSKHPDLGTVASFSLVPAMVDGHGLAVTATDPTSYTKLIDLDVLEGSMSDLGDDGVAIATAEVNKRGYRLGSKLDFKLVDGSTQTLTVRAIYDNVNMAGQMIASRKALQRGMLLPIAQMAFVEGAPGVAPAKVRDEVEKLAASDPTAKVMTSKEFRKSAAAQMNSFLNIVYAMLALAVIIALIGIWNTLGLSIIERTRELGLLRAVGMTRKQLRATIRTEAILIALTGTLIGVVLGTSIGSALIKSIPRDQGLLGFAVPTTRLVVVLVAGVLVGLVAAIVPARRAARLNPLEALATE